MQNLDSITSVEDIESCTLSVLDDWFDHDTSSDEN